MNYLYSLIGAFFMAYAVKNVLEPMQMVIGGVSGIAIIVKNATAGWFPDESLLADGIPLWITTIVLNVPLFVAAYCKAGKELVWNSLWGVMWLSVFLVGIPLRPLISEDYLLCTLLSGLLYGIGVGLVLKAKSSTGGSDLLASICQKKYPQYSIPKIMAMVDGVIVILGVLVFGIEKGLYALITIYAISRVSDFIIAGLSRTLVTYIISDYASDIAQAILKEVRRGVTQMDVKGVYQKKNRIMLMCAVNKKQLVWIKEIVAKYDENSFVIVVEARETLGLGFHEISNNIR